MAESWGQVEIQRIWHYRPLKQLLNALESRVGPSLSECHAGVYQISPTPPPPTPDSLCSLCAGAISGKEWPDRDCCV